MKSIITLLLLLFSIPMLSQKKGFEFLAQAKTSLETVIKTYASVIPDTSTTFRHFFVPLARNYNKAKANYNGYRGAMKDCILNNESKKKIQYCLQSKSVDIQNQLDSLDGILENAYMDAASKGILKENIPTYSGHNTGLFTGDFIKALLDTLINGTLKLWDQTKKYRKEYKDNFLTNISSKEYELADLEDLLKSRITSIK